MDLIKRLNIIEEYNLLSELVRNELDSPGKGGNVSVKLDEFFIVKASGEDLKEEHRMCLFENNEFKEQIKIKKTKIKSSNKYLKPTMEIGFHKVIKAKYVLHYHPVYVLPFLCVQNIVLTDMYCDVIEASLPGKDLEIKIKDFFINNKKDYGILLLKNHGVIIYADDIETVKLMYTHLRFKYFKYLEIDNNYTPDDVVDKESFQLLLFRNAMQNIATKNDLILEELNSDMVKSLLEDENEKYRQQKMKGNK